MWHRIDGCVKQTSPILSKILNFEYTFQTNILKKGLSSLVKRVSDFKFERQFHFEKFNVTGPVEGI